MREWYLNSYARNITQTTLLIVIFILQIIFLIASFDLSKNLSVSDIASIIQVILIVIGFFVAYNQIIFSRKMEERSRIWKKIYSLEKEYIDTRVAIARKFLDFIDDENITDEEPLNKYLVDIFMKHSNFRVKLDNVFDQILYNTSAIKKAYENFLKKDDERIRNIGIKFIIALTSKSSLIDKESRDKARVLTENFQIKLKSIKNIFNDNDYKKFKEEIRQILH